MLLGINSGRTDDERIEGVSPPPVLGRLSWAHGGGLELALQRILMSTVLTPSWRRADV